MEVLRYGYRIPFICDPPLSRAPISLPSYHPSSIKGVALRDCSQALVAKSAVELAPLPSLGFYSRLFVVWKTSGSWRPVIDLSTLNLFVDVAHFRMETIQSVLLSVRQGDWMASIDLKEAYLQIPVHPDSRRFLRFVALGRVYQFSALCFGLSTAPQVFSRVMAPVSAILHSWGIRMRRYLDDWLVQSSSRDALLHDLQVVLSLCRELGIVVNPSKSHLVPSQVVQYLGVVIDSRSFRASPSSERVSKLFSTADAFLSCAAPPASTWLRLLGILSSLAHLVPGGRLRVRSLQLCLHQQWDLVCADPVVSALPQGSSVVARPSSSVSRGVSRPGLPRSGLLVRRLGRGLGCSPRLSHRFRPLGPGAGCAVHQRARAPGYQGGPPPFSALSPRVGCLGFLRQQHCGVLSTQGGGHQVSVSELSGSGDPALDGVSFHSTPAPVHSGVSERPRGLPLSSSPTSSYRMVPSSGGFSIFKSSLAGANRLVCHVSKSPMLSLFLSLPGSIGGGHRRVPPVLGRASGLRLPSVVHSSQGASQAPCVSGSGADANSPLLASTPLVCGPPSSVAGSSGGSAPPPRPPAPASVSLPLPGSPKASASCLATLRRFTRAAGFSSAVAAQASLSRRPSSRKAYQLKWQVYRQWCHSCGHSSSNPSLAKTADFLCWLHSSKHLGVSSIKGYRSMLSAVFRFQLPSLSSHPVLRDLLRSFALESAPRQLRPPAWDLTLVLRFLNTSIFEPLTEVPLRALTQKVLFLIAFATAKRVGELQALSSVVTFVHGDACLSYVPDFVAKSESLSRSIPRSFLVRSLSDFAAGLEDDLLLCPVRALRIYLDRLSTLSPLRRHLFVSPSRPSRPLSKNAISFFLRDVISHAGASRPEVGRLRAHDIRGVSTSVAFHRNWSVSSVLESATWASSSVFTSFYLRDLQHEFDGILSLGPFVAAGSTIG